MRQHDQSMKTMKLYNKVERIITELHALGIDDDAPLSVDDLTPFDQYHYYGTEAVDHAQPRSALGRTARCSKWARALAARPAIWRTAQSAMSPPLSCSPI